MAELAENEAKKPRTERGRRTMRKLLDAAAVEFGERGFHEASISSITQRAGVALGSFYTYFDGKDAIFASLVQYLSQGVAEAAMARMAPDSAGIRRECEALAGFLDFARANKGVYRIIDEAEFIDPAGWLGHYEGTARRITGRLDEAVAAGLVEAGDNEVRAWAFMGMSVFLGLRFAVLDDTRPIDEVIAVADDLLRRGMAGT